MIENKVHQMIEQAIELKNAITIDIEDVKNAQHEELLKRNDEKLLLMQNISTAHEELNTLLASEIQNGIDVNIYRDVIGELEVHLKELYELNGKLASIVLPVKQMYKNIIDEISAQNGGTLLEVNA
jgi:uncharacterized protein YpmS